MAARNADVQLNENTFTQLTDSDVSSIRVQSAAFIWLQATNGTTEPTSTAGAVSLRAYEVWAADLTLAQVWPGVTGANRVWAKTYNGGATVSVSHA